MGQGIFLGAFLSPKAGTLYCLIQLILSLVPSVLTLATYAMNGQAVMDAEPSGT